jgi:hypothetical protein
MIFFVIMLGDAKLVQRVHPLEYFSAQQLWQLIDDSADSFYALLSSFNLSVDHSSIPQNL